MEDGGLKSSLTSGRTTPQFDDAIKQLDREQQRLQQFFSDTKDAIHSTTSNSPPPPSPSRSSSRSGRDLAALTDISGDQRAFEELRRETERLQQSLQSTTRPTLTSTLNSLGPVEGRSESRGPLDCGSLDRGSLDIPLHTGLAGAPQLNSTLVAGDAHLLNSSSVRLEALQEGRLKEDILHLKKQLADEQHTSRQQKDHFRQSVTELRGQLQEACITRDQALAKLRNESSGQESMILRYKKSTEQLEHTNRAQEKALYELNGKLESMQKEHYVYDSALEQLRAALGERERRRGKAFFDSDPSSSQQPSMLVHTAERALQEADGEAEGQRNKIRQLSLEVDSLKSSLQERTDLLSRDHEARLRDVKDEHTRRMTEQEERVLSAERKLAAMQEQLTRQQSSSEREVRNKADHILELEGRLTALRREMEDEQRTWNKKRDSLQGALDTAEREVAGMMCDRDKAVQQNSTTQTRFEDMQKTIERLSTDMRGERQRADQLVEKESEWRLKEERLTLEVKHKEEVIKRLEESLAAVRREADTQIQTTISNLEKEGKDYIERQVSQLKTQLEAMTDRCHKEQLEAELAKAEHRNVKEKYDELRTRSESLSRQLEEACTKRDTLNTMLQEKLMEQERGNKERDALSKMVEDRGIELINVRSERDKYQVQLEEREKNYLTLKQQNENINQIVDSHSHNTLALRAERDELNARVNEKIIETEEVRHARDAAIAKARALKQKLEDVTQDSTRLALEIQQQQKAYSQAEQQNTSLLDELKQSRYEVANLVEKCKTLEQQRLSRDAEVSRDVSKMGRRIKGLEKELKLAQQTLQAREKGDGKAVKVAGKMQKEVTEKRGEIDSLRTELNWLKDCYEAHIMKKKDLEHENEELNETVQSTGKQNERLTSQLKEAMTRNAEEQDTRRKLETQTEKASLKELSLNASIEQLQQDIAKLKLKHQLELKEAMRTSKARKQESLPPDAYKPSSQPAPQYIQQAEKAGHRYDLEDVPVSIKPQQRTGEKERREDEEPEMMALLKDLKGMLHTQQNQISRNKHKRSPSPEDSELDTTDYSSSMLRKPFSKSSSSHRSSKPRPVTHKSSSSSRPRPRSASSASQYSRGGRGGKDASDVYDYSSYSRDDFDVTNGGGDTTTAAGVNDDTTGFSRDFDSLEQLAMDVKSAKESLSATRKTTKPSKTSNAIGSSSAHNISQDVPPPTSTLAFAKRLEKKMEDITRIGTKLQDKNKEVARMMKDSEKKIQRVKGQIRKT